MPPINDRLRQLGDAARQFRQRVTGALGNLGLPIPGDSPTLSEPIDPGDAARETIETMSGLAARANDLYDGIVQYAGQLGTSVEDSPVGARIIPDAIRERVNDVISLATSLSGNMEAYGHASADLQIMLYLEERHSEEDGGMDFALASAGMNSGMVAEVVKLTIQGYGIRQIISALGTSLQETQRTIAKPGSTLTGRVIVAGDEGKGNMAARDPDMPQVLTALISAAQVEHALLRTEVTELDLSGQASREIKGATNQNAAITQIITEAVEAEDIATMLELLAVATFDFSGITAREEGVVSQVRRGLGAAGKALEAYFDRYVAYYANTFFQRSVNASQIDLSLAENQHFQTLVCLYFLRSQSLNGLQPGSVSQLLEAGFFPNLPDRIDNFLSPSYSLLFQFNRMHPYDLVMDMSLQSGISANVIRAFTRSPITDAIMEAHDAFMTAIPQINKVLEKADGHAIDIQNDTLGQVHIERQGDYLNVRTTNIDGEVLVLQIGPAPRNIFGIPASLSQQEEQAVYAMFAALHEILVEQHILKPPPPPPAKPATRPKSEKRAPAPAPSVGDKKLGDRATRMEEHAGLPRQPKDKTQARRTTAAVIPATQDHMPTAEGRFGVEIDDDARGEIPSRKRNKILRQELGDVLTSLQQELIMGNGRSPRLRDVEGVTGVWRVHVGVTHRVFVVIEDDKIRVVGFGPKAGNRAYRRIINRFK